MNLEQLRRIAQIHAEQIKTTCKFMGLADYYELKDNDYIFFAIFQCKRSLRIRRIILT